MVGAHRIRTTRSQWEGKGGGLGCQPGMPWDPGKLCKEGVDTGTGTGRGRETGRQEEAGDQMLPTVGPGLGECR